MSQVLLARLNASDASFSTSLLTLTDMNRPIHLLLESGTTLLNLKALTKWMETAKPCLFKLSLPVNKLLIDSPEFISLIKALKNNTPDSLELFFEDNEVLNSAQEIEARLIKTITPVADFPITIANSKTKKRYRLKRLKLIWLKAYKAQGDLVND